MQAPLPQRTLLSSVLSLLLLSMALARHGCSSPYARLLSQLKNQANMTEDTRSLLEPYILLQGLNTDALRKSCTESPSVFPSEDALRELSKPDFLRAVHSTLGHILHGLDSLRKQFLKSQDLETLELARSNVQGIKNNIYCMAWLLGGSVETPEPTRVASGTPPTLTPTPDVFQAKLKSCRLLWGYHHFMGSVGRVFRDWGDSQSRRRRHSPRRALHKGDHRTRPSRRRQRSKSRGQLRR